PLTPNGKVDRASLPDPRGLELPGGDEYIAPRNEIEVKIVEAISTISGKPVDKISIDHNFFDIGLNSLGLMKLYSMISKEVESDLQVVSVFEFPTISALAEYLSGAQESTVLESEDEDILNDMDEMIDLM
ncbi:MAG: phosphopantetheine-binding protein, partial [Cyclobacteriaceae bacterium]